MNHKYREILTFSVSGLASPSFIGASTVSINVIHGTDVNALFASFTISSGASINATSGAAYNFSNPIEFVVTAEDGVTKKIYVITVNILAVQGGDEEGGEEEEGGGEPTNEEYSFPPALIFLGIAVGLMFILKKQSFKSYLLQKYVQYIFFLSYHVRRPNIDEFNGRIMSIIDDYHHERWIEKIKGENIRNKPAQLQESHPAIEQKKFENYS